MIPYAFTKYSEAEFLKLPKAVQRRILKKLEHFLISPHPLAFAKRMAAVTHPTYRYRIGDYRVIFDWEETGILILRVGHRREVYR